jgi:tetratricopeptide (TPR) repeat protein
MKHVRFAVAAVVLAGCSLAACGGSGPTQAEGPRPNLDSPPTGTDGDKGSAELADAHAAVAAKDFKTARAKAEAILQKNPKHAEALFVVGECDEADHKDEDAVAHYRAALAADPGLLGAAINLSALLIDLKRFGEAADVARAGLKSGKGAVELHINLAYALKGKGDHATAAKAFANALRFKPESADLYVEYGDELHAAGDNPGAQKAYKNAVAKAGDDVALIAAAGIGLSQSDDAPGCVAAFDTVLAKKSSADFLTDRAICKHKAGDLGGARADADASIKIKPNIRAHTVAAMYAEEAKDKKACRAHFAEVAKMGVGTRVETDAKKGIERCK